MSAQAIGTGRLQGCLAPNFHGAIAGAFIIPKHNVVVYGAAKDGWRMVGSFPDGVMGWSAPRN